MTRETKIGLLVGLAFIIVIGILLSDHLTSSTEPPPAPMSQAGSIVRSAVNTPAPVQQPVAEIATPQVQPNQPVRSADDFQPRPQPVKIVQVNTPQQNEPVTITSPNTNPETPLATQSQKPAASAADTSSQNATANSNTATPPATVAQTPPVSDPILSRLNSEAAKHGEAIVPINNPQAQPAASVTKYKVESGDSLSKIASKVYGSNSKANIQAIIDANPSLKENPNLVVEGRTYNIPVIAGAKMAVQTNNAVASATQAPKQPAAQTQQQPAGQAKIEAGATYVVLEGDNLTRIAREQCGTDDAVAAIKELNREMLKGGDVIRPGMKLKLPAKSLASGA